MLKISVLLSTAALVIFNSGARATNHVPFALPHPAVVAILALAGIGLLLLMARVLLGGKHARAPSLPAFWPTPRASFALLAMVAFAGTYSLV